MEKRDFEIEGLKLEARSDGKPGKIGGYAAVFEKLSEPLGFGNIREKIQKGTFANSIQNGDVRAFWSHNMDLVLGRTRNGSLKLQEDDHGLRFDLQLPDTTLGRDAFVSIERGDVSGMSFGFTVKADKWERGKEGSPHIRTLLDVELLEVSPTAFPAYPQTSVALRESKAELEERIKEMLAKFDAEDPEKNKQLVEFKARQQVIENDLRFSRSLYL